MLHFGFAGLTYPFSKSNRENTPQIMKIQNIISS